MESQEKVPVRVIQVTESLSKFRQMMPTISFLVDAGVGFVAGAYIAFFLAENEPVFLVSGLLLMVIMPIGGVLSYCVLTYAFQRSQHPIMLHKDGVEFHSFTLDRLLRQPSYVPASRLTEITVDIMVDPKDPETPKGSPQMFFRTTDKRFYATGERSRAELDRAVEFIRKEWDVPVIDRRRSSTNGKIISEDEIGRTSGKARKVPVASPPERSEPAAISPPIMSFCPSCGGGLVRGSRFCPACEHQFGPSVQAGGRVNGKKSRTAFLLGLLPGLLGLMGLGHIYVGRKIIGIALMAVGVILALFAFASMLILFDPGTDLSEGGALIAAALFNIPFLGLLIWSSLDARDRAGRPDSG